MKSFKDYLDHLSENDNDDELKDLNDDCDDCEDDEITESAQIKLELLQQIQPKLAKAPLNVLKQVVKRLEAGSQEE